MNELDYYCYLRTLDAGPIEVPRSRDAMIAFRYQIRVLLREPVWIVIVMIQPLLYLALFAPLFDPLLKTIGLICAAVLAVIGVAVVTRTFQHESA